MHNNQNNRDSVARSVGVILLGIIALALFYNVFFGPGYMGGYGMNDMNDMHGGGAMGGGFGLNYSLGSLLAGILLILIKLLSILLVVGLVAGVWIVVRDYLWTNGENPLAGFLSASKNPCPRCGKANNPNWNYCPSCGEAMTGNLDQDKADAK